MKDARFTIPTPALLSRVVDMLDHVPMDERNPPPTIQEAQVALAWEAVARVDSL
jgi:hypothetical protein